MGKKKHKCTCRPQNPNIEKREVFFKLYFNPYIKDSYTRIYDVLLETYNRTYDAIYKDVKENPDIAYEVCLKKAEESVLSRVAYNPEYDYGCECFEQIQDDAVDLMQEQSLMHYQFVLMSLSNLYQVFEQQLRKWLFEEMTQHHNEYINQIKFTLNNEEKDYGEFYSQFGALRNVLQEMKLTFTMPTKKITEWDAFFGVNEDSGIEVPIVETEIWQTIRECNLLSNTFKHGSGTSAIALYKMHPEYFEKVSDTKLMNLYRTTNMEEVLSVDKISFEKYATAMKNFWEKLKTHQSGSVKLEIDISSDQEIQEKESITGK
ncbi:hypothetical protein AEA09_14820 [Lysinibacillus contaminans]|uniref:Uncharacterized protein n=1 Tax=Lysinibacillus contaminans TaxID=1293441 RepID=A0ABR5JXU2_9BACI|nr:hypothetical protein [Lysinibacillus contaminans]KOS67122.1 hypothetical protein AEA09_14820 [Lysinibacillus contaminans]